MEVQRQLGHCYYKRIWYILQKIRYAMGKTDEDYQLCDEVELEENGGRYKRGEGAKNRQGAGNGRIENGAPLPRFVDEPVLYIYYIGSYIILNWRLDYDKSI